MRIVTIIDGSYNLTLCKRGLESVSGRKLMERSFEIICDGCDLPATSSGLSGKKRNNTIIRAIDDGEIVFIQERFLKPKHTCNKCPECGSEITL